MRLKTWFCPVYTVTNSEAINPLRNTKNGSRRHNILFERKFFTLQSIRGIMNVRLKTNSLEPKMKLVLTVENFSRDEGKYDQDNSYLIVENFVPDYNGLQKQVDDIVKMFNIETRNDYEDGDFFWVTVVDWSVETDDYLSPREEMEAKYDDGGVRYWDARLDPANRVQTSKLRGYDGKMYLRTTPLDGEYSEVCLDA